MPSMPDAELARAAQRGEKRAFVEIVARHQAMVCGVAMGVLGDFAASEDAAQEAFVTAWRKIHDLREPQKLRSWLAQIARNAALGHRRRTRGTQPLDDLSELSDDDPTPDQAAVSDEEATLVREALEALPENYRGPLILFYRQDQSVRAVAETLELSEDAVRQRLSRGREMLRERMSGLIESTLLRTQPSAIFTMTIAAAIGALATPAAIAGGAFATVAATSTATASTAPVVTAMTTSKLSFTTAALVAVACLPLGYAVHLGTEKASSGGTVAPAAQRSSPKSFKPDFGDSPLFAEWRRLHEAHGHDAAAMPALFKAISDVKDPFRRRAFRAALVAEWGQVDPAGGLDFFLKQNDGSLRTQLFREWLAHDPQAAMAKLASCGEAGDKLAHGVLTDIARKAPDHVAAIAARLPAETSYWNHPVADAFAIIAEENLQSARSSAEALTGPQHTDALAGVAKAWAKRDLEGALAWAKALPDGDDRDEIIRHALMGVASTNPAQALDRLRLVPPGGRSGYFATTTGARVLKEAAAHDFEATTAWLAANHGKVSHEDLMGLANEVTQRLNAHPEKFLSQHLASGSLGALAEAVNSALLNESKPQCAVVWEWLKHQPQNEVTRRLRDAVVNSAGYQDPALALVFAREIPTTTEGNRELERIAQSLLNGGSRLDRLESLLPQAPERLRAQLLETGFRSLRPDTLDDPAAWQARLAAIPHEARGVATTSLAAAWAGQRPEEAAAWASQLGADAGRPEALKAVAQTWATRDPFAASEWVTQLAAGPERDAGAAALVSAVARDAPDEAWQWALSITDPYRRLAAAGETLAALADRDSAAALRWIDTASFSSNEKASLRTSLEARSSRPVK